VVTPSVEALAERGLIDVKGTSSRQSTCDTAYVPTPALQCTVILNVVTDLP